MNDNSKDHVLFFEEGMVFPFDGKAHQVRYEDIDSIRLPDEKKSYEVLVTTKSGQTYEVPIRGKNGNFSDSLEVYRFLSRVLSDLKK